MGVYTYFVNEDKPLFMLAFRNPETYGEDDYGINIFAKERNWRQSTRDHREYMPEVFPIKLTSKDIHYLIQTRGVEV